MARYLQGLGMIITMSLNGTRREPWRPAPRPADGPRRPGARAVTGAVFDRSAAGHPVLAAPGRRGTGRGLEWQRTFRLALGGAATAAPGTAAPGTP
jgi:hypothetical protein